MNTPKTTSKKLEQAQANLAKLETALPSSKQHEIDLQAEHETLAQQHRQDATAKAIEGQSPPSVPFRLAEINAEITTCRGVISDIEAKLVDSKAEVVKAELEHEAACRRAVVSKIEKQGQKLWLEIADRFTELVDLAGETGLDAVERLTETTGPFYPEHDPILRALKAEGLDYGDGCEVDIVPAGTVVMDITDGIIERHNGEKPERIGTRY